MPTPTGFHSTPVLLSVPGQVRVIFHGHLIEMGGTFWPRFGFNLLIGPWNCPKPWREAQRDRATATSAVSADLSHSDPEPPLFQKSSWAMWEEGLSPVKDSIGRLLFGESSDLDPLEMKTEATGSGSKVLCFSMVCDLHVLARCFHAMSIHCC